MITIVHLSLRLRCTKKICLNKKNICKTKEGSGQDVRRSERPLLACHIRRKYSIEICRNLVRSQVMNKCKVLSLEVVIVHCKV